MRVSLNPVKHPHIQAMSQWNQFPDRAAKFKVYGSLLMVHIDGPDTMELELTLWQPPRSEMQTKDWEIHTDITQVTHYKVKASALVFKLKSSKNLNFLRQCKNLSGRNLSMLQGLISCFQGQLSQDGRITMTNIELLDTVRLESLLKDGDKQLAEFLINMDRTIHIKLKDLVSWLYELDKLFAEAKRLLPTTANRRPDQALFGMDNFFVKQELDSDGFERVYNGCVETEADRQAQEAAELAFLFGENPAATSSQKGHTNGTALEKLHPIVSLSQFKNNSSLKQSVKVRFSSIKIIGYDYSEEVMIVLGYNAPYHVKPFQIKISDDLIQMTLALNKDEEILPFLGVSDLRQLRQSLPEINVKINRINNSQKGTISLRKLVTTVPSKGRLIKYSTDSSLDEVYHSAVTDNSLF
ncbi:Hypothetical protein PP7435_CHR3-1743 [Komagataella phaffii CBS 7435]|uniref:Uncharacterized protein n=2 Tax=Komagataella phaffii TaxID=460519 RepID=C4R5M8_KOMPG|nr:Hypothetical protein PAS_chr3_0811 [Komagataella phaffii GS115]AOA63998.1 GQ67_03916T0 [Komagataella phaffii]CAH2449332.1 Hypothetical protein BQ9382_C3-2055 [Komagataella phaffii CBS 7435]AOA68699.1 GQ68_03890T0 [Komagataella phaffii GS115]CAY70864.1 Hypothetical protein PAS_chr3_0811 [Komagataella phaffii GS115]SCV12191.1 Hypothetical protein PP7435_CHR3-1743 [Komagataella phaffii CBS 7435]